MTTCMCAMAGTAACNNCGRRFGIETSGLVWRIPYSAPEPLDPLKTYTLKTAEDAPIDYDKLARKVADILKNDKQAPDEETKLREQLYDIAELIVGLADRTWAEGEKDHFKAIIGKILNELETLKNSTTSAS